MYATMSYNDPKVRENAFKVFSDDLKSKKMDESASENVLKKMYEGFVSELSAAGLKKIGIDRKKYFSKVDEVTDLRNPDYEQNQRYFVAALTKIFNSPDLRYDSLKGFIQALVPYLAKAGKQGSIDKNTMGQGGGMGSGGGAGSSGDAGGSGSGDGEGGEDSGDGDDG